MDVFYVYLGGAALIALSVGLVVGSIVSARSGKGKLAQSRIEAEKIIREAQSQAKTLHREADIEIKSTQLKLKTEFEQELQSRQKEMQLLEKRLLDREENLEKKFDKITERENDFIRREQSLNDRKKGIETQEKKYLGLVEEARIALERVAGVSREEAKRHLIESLENDAKRDAAKLVKEIEEEAKSNAEKKAQYIIGCTIERMASDYSAERAVSVVHLPSDEMKGRIIGREGRNIRALEAATGIDIVIDDTPEAVVLSGFNPVRREVAKRTLEALIQDGRIHPARIEEMVNKITKDVEADIKQAGEQALYEVGIPNMHPEFVKLLGQLKYRYSYAQNVLRHSIEVAHLCGMLAAELGVNQKKAKRAGLLHDVGKAVTHEMEGSHALIGMDFAKKYREDPDVCHAIGAHHEDIPQESVLDVIVDAADAISGARPGARREVMEAYTKRLEELERITTSYNGVEKAYAIQAGREVRVMVNPEDIDDIQATVLSRDIAKQIENELTYPGQIKVTVIREKRAVEFAK